MSTTTITDEQIAEIEAGAQLATKGDWCTDGAAWVCAKDSDQLNNGYVLAICEGPDDADNAAHIAACSPVAILALISRLRAAERDAARYQWLRDVAPATTGTVPMVSMADEYGGRVSDWIHGNRLDDKIDAAMVLPRSINE